MGERTRRERKAPEKWTVSSFGVSRFFLASFSSLQSRLIPHGFSSLSYSYSTFSSLHSHLIHN